MPQHTSDEPPSTDSAPRGSGRILKPLTEADYARWKAFKPRPFNLEDEAERARLLRETQGFAHVSLHERDGTDLEGREYAHDALKHAIMMGYRLVPPEGQ